MKIPRIRSTRLVSAMLASGVALSVVLGPAFLPANVGGSVARADLVVSIDLFQQELSPYGRWGDDPRYGQVWYPNVREGWRPYYDDGHWVYSDDYGWLWVADQPWGWAPFHYGRWVLTDYGWAWVPGTTWGPAWVTFRSAPEYIGWAPLPPDADWDDGYGFRRRYDVRDDRYWSFVRPEGFVQRRFDRYAYDRRDNRRFIQHTTNITNITIINNRVVNRGIDVNHVERETHHHVDRFRVADSDRPARTELQGNKVFIYKPAITGQGHKERMNSGSVTNGQQPTNGGNDTQQVPPKKTHNNGNAIVNGGSQQQQFVAPNGQQPAVGTNDNQQLLLKKKHNNGNANLNGGSQQQFVAPNQMQPAAGVEQPQQVPLKKKHNNGNANFNGGQQQQFVFPNNGGASAGNGQPQWKPKQHQQQINNQAQGQQFQPQVRQTKPQVQQFQQQPQQNNSKNYKVNKKSTHQCQSGDAAACGN
ncbi:MAG TPA: DUF6600 domain-containing protein [Candidatus Angelobacter sp.]|nr:DUF6600 domain-containing protein [Candidatus Angelobacter sp.]